MKVGPKPLRFLAVVSAGMVVMLIVSCGDPQPPNLQTLDDENSATNLQRWYSEDQVLAGSEVFAQHCAVCHGAGAEGTVSDWRRRLDDGSFPPPPLNGTAHAWHHPNSILLQVINNGGVAFGGRMPGFADILSEADKLAAIAYFQNFWDDEIYGHWEQMGGVN